MKTTAISDFFSKPPYAVNETVLLKYPASMRMVYEVATEITDEFCRKYLDEEYATVCQRVVAALCRKRPSPLLGRANTSYTQGIIYLVASTNFLFDKSQHPHMTAQKLCELLEIAKSTAHQKASRVLKDLGWNKHDYRLALPKNLAGSPLIWMVTLRTGMIYDVRNLPLPMRMQAFADGTIPYIPVNLANNNELLLDAALAIEIGELELAENLLQHIEKTDPTLIPTYYLYSLLRLEQDRDAESDEYTELGYQKTCAKFPDWPAEINWGNPGYQVYLKIIFDMAQVFYNRGDLSEATKTYELLLKLTPGDELGCRFLLAAIYKGLTYREIDTLLDAAEEHDDWEQINTMLNRQNAKHKFWKEPKI